MCQCLCAVVLFEGHVLDPDSGDISEDILVWFSSSWVVKSLF